MGVTADGYAGMLAGLLPRGRVWRIAESVLADLLLGSSDELARVDGRVTDLFNEADPSTATELLPEYELELDLQPAATTAERRANIVARRVARQRFRPVDFQTALASLLAQVSSDVVVLERTHALAAALGDEREIYRFFVFRDPSVAGTYYIASAQALVDAIAPSHTAGYVIESVSAVYDDAHSLYDRDLIGTIPSFVSASAPVVTRGTSLVVSAPAGTAAGDTVLLLAWCANDATATITLSALPAGWSVLSSILTSASRRVLLLRRIATASEPGSHTFPCTADGSNVVNGVCLAYRGIEASVPVAAAGASDATSTTSFVSPTVTLTRSNDVYLGFAWGNNNTATTSAPSGTTERVNASATQDGFTHVEAFDMQPFAAGAAGTKTTTFSVSCTGVAAAYVLHAQQIPVS